jgi:hypothetical protein
MWTHPSLDKLLHWVASNAVKQTLALYTRTCDVRIIVDIPYRLYITAQKYRFLPGGVTVRTKNIYLFWGCGIEKRGFWAYFGACQAKIPVRGWCNLNSSRVRG